WVGGRAPAIHQSGRRRGLPGQDGRAIYGASCLVRSDVGGGGGGARCRQLVEVLVDEVQDRSLARMDGSAGEDHRGDWILPNELSWLVAFASDRSVLLDRGFAYEVELIGRQKRGNPEQLAVDEVIEQKFRFDTGNRGGIVLSWQINAGVNNPGGLMPRL